MLFGSVSQAAASPFETIFTVHSIGNGIGGNNATGTAFAQCPPGTQLVGGGAFWNNTTTNKAIVRSVPAVGANGWEVTGHNWSGIEQSLFATAQCGLPKPNGGFSSTFAQVSSGSFVGAGGTDTESVGCPPDTQLLSGGGVWEKPNQSFLGWVKNEVNFVNGPEWTVTGRNWSNTGVKLWSVALCGIPGPSGGFSQITDALSLSVRALGPGVWTQFGRCTGQLISVGGSWPFGEPFGREGGVALTAFERFGSSSEPEFYVEGGNMSNLTLPLRVHARCGT